MAKTTRLKRRIAAAGGNMAGAQQYLAGITPATPMEMPVARITYNRDQAYPAGTAIWGGSVTYMYEDLQPLWTQDGAMIPASANAGWGWVAPAGRL
jgi:hypothetical protein